MDIMHDEHEILAGLDLNLLVAFTALLEERHVTRAAHRLGLTQPAMSQSLARLRTMLKDPLLVRTKNGMMPTARAEAMREPLALALESIVRAIAPPVPFDPKVTARRWRLATSDYVELVLLPKLLPHLSTAAPRFDLRIVNHGAATNAELEDGKLDLAIVPGAPETGGFYGQKLFDDRFVCVVRKDHPTVKSRLSLEQYVALPHLLVAPRGDGGGSVDIALARLGKRRRVAVQVPHFLVTPHLLVQTDLVITLAERVARTFTEMFGLRILAPPLELEGFSMSLVWHERAHGDPAHAWLRTVIAKLARSL
jgi:DNA-binding transcriptional LysR family regulator